METVEERLASLSPAQRELLQSKLKQMNNKKKEKSGLLLTLQSGDVSKRRPIFCFHTHMGATGYYLNIVRHLNDEQPVYGVQSPGFCGTGSAFDDMEVMAGHYLEAIRTVQAEPPYVFVGHSSAAFIAFEMALQVANHSVNAPLLVVIDEAAPIGEEDPIMEALKVPNIVENDQAMFLSAWLVSLMHDQELTFSLEDISACSTLDKKYTLIANFLRQTGFVSANSPDSIVAQLLQTVANHVVADSKYYKKHTPDGADTKYEGRTVLMRCTEETVWRGFDTVSPPDTSEFSNWDKFCSGPIDVIGIPSATHLTMVMEPCAQSVAEHLQHHIDKITPI